MPIVQAFSKIDVILKSGQFKSGCLIDSNLLVAFGTLEPHPFYEDAEFLFEKFAEYQIPLFVTHTVRTEYLDQTRRRIMTDSLMGLLSNPNAKLSQSVRTELKRHQTWINDQIRKGELPTLTDQRIKGTKQVFDPRNHSGHLGWMKLCEEYLGKKLLKHWNDICDDLSLNYAILRGDGSESFLEKDLVWEEMYGISEKTALSSSDSMILNAFHASKLRMIASADYDLGYACASKGDKGRICLVPDRIYVRNLKGLRFPS